MSGLNENHSYATTDDAITDTHMKTSDDTAASTTRVATPVASVAATSSQSIPASGGSWPRGLAMDRNPTVNAIAPPSVPISTVTDPALFAPSSAVSNHASVREGSADPTPPIVTSATGWLVPPAETSKPRITFEEYLSLSEITFEWGDSYDDKDWMRLRAILAPTLRVDYSEVNGHRWDSMPAAEFVGIMSHIGFVGDPLVHTQHHIGASKWQKISDKEVIGHHQLRAAHQRYTGPDLKVVENKGHGHAMVQHFYRKIEGEWKLAGLRPRVRWNEFEFEKIFKGF